MGGAKTVDQPDDPDPTPTVSSDTSTEVQGASRQAKKRQAKSYGRSQSILTGNTDEQKKTVLGA